MSLRGGALAWTLCGAQAATAGIAALVAGWVGGTQAAQAALFGGFAVLAPSAYFAAKIFIGRRRKSTAADVVGAFYRAELVKLLCTVVLFYLGARWFGSHFATLILSSSACLAMNWVMLAATRLD